MNVQDIWNRLRQFIIENGPPLPPNFWDEPRTEEERKIKTQVIHTLMSLMDGDPPDSCDCDCCLWTREYVLAPLERP